MGTTWAQQALLFRNIPNPRNTKNDANDRVFERVGAAPGSGLATAFPARGLAIADLDGDGRLDAVLNNCDAPPTLLRNVTDTKNHWLILRLSGDVTKKNPRDATGALVYATIGAVRQRLDLISGAGYASQNVLPNIARPARKLITRMRWPTHTERVSVPGIDRVLTSHSGQGLAYFL